MNRFSLPTVDSCAGCGACCTGQEALPVGWYIGILAPKHIKLPPALQAEVEDMFADFQRTGWPSNGEPCVWYDADKKQCKHYEWRPDVCRELKIDSDGCHRWRRRLGIESGKFTLKNGKVVKA